MYFRSVCLLQSFANKKWRANALAWLVFPMSQHFVFLIKVSFRMRILEQQAMPWSQCCDALMMPKPWCPRPWSQCLDAVAVMHWWCNSLDAGVLMPKHWCQMFWSWCLNGQCFDDDTLMIYFEPFTLMPMPWFQWLEADASMLMPWCWCLDCHLLMPMPCCWYLDANACLEADALMMMPWCRCLDCHLLMPIPWCQCLEADALMAMPWWSSLDANALTLIPWWLCTPWSWCQCCDALMMLKPWFQILDTNALMPKLACFQLVIRTLPALIIMWFVINRPLIGWKLQEQTVRSISTWNRPLGRYKIQGRETFNMCSPAIIGLIDL